MSGPMHRRSFFRSMNLVAAGAVGAPVAMAAGARAQQASSLPTSADSLANTPAGFIHPNKVLLWENTRKEMRQWIMDGTLKAAILPTGSVEQHNEHMAMVADVAIATLICQRAALNLYPQVVVAPPSPCGYAPYHMMRKGSLTLRRETLQAYVLDVLSCLKAQGIRTLLVLNGHGGNHQPLVEMLPAWREQLGSNVNIDVDSYWTGTPRVKTKAFMRAEEATSHAGEFETSIYMAAFPERLRYFTMQQYDHAHLDYETVRSPEIAEFLRRDERTHKDGKIDLSGENLRDRRRQEEALLATAETGEKILSMAIEFVTDRLRQMMAATEAGKPWPAT
jgi:creatinine amidohydrolase/Fe(II)-dependent formamide hydrolase-like protein